jgi:diguanylate cyclase (GGDEF)-like protein
MQEAIDAAIEHLRAGGDPAAVLLIDVDPGHAAGDALLVALAQRMALTLTREDLVARFDGHVFVVVAHEIGDEAAAYELASQLTGTLEEPLHVGDGAAASVHVSIGVSMLREGDATVGAVVARADAAMYAARNKASRDARRGDCSPWSARDALVEAAFERSTIEDFDVYYQPIADLRCGSVAAVEAILRWEHPDLGTISPLEFLAIAERQGQMVTLGRHVIERACAQTVRWQATRDGLPMRTCVNVSAAQLADPAFLEDVLTALARSGATGQQLALELTAETLAGAEPQLLRALVDARVELTLDQYGVGASSHASLGLLPISTVKLDRSIVVALAGEPPAIVRETAERARGLGLRAVAVGVETLAQLQAVRDSGYALAQGHLFSRPLSGPAIEELVHRERPFSAVLAPRPAWLDFDSDRDGPAIEVGAPAVPEPAGGVAAYSGAASAVGGST